MRARYLVRFDDICPTMNWPVWEEVERILLEVGCKPILSVIPSNRDESLNVHEAIPDFWDRVRRWQSRGWVIGLHGYQHLYSTRDAGLVGIKRRSEFSGLSFAEQQSMLRQALGAFERERVAPDLWVAPGHSFDTTTLRALYDLGIRYVSDGFSLYPYLDSQSVLWVPQQLWRFRKMPLGLWTVCLHVNQWTPAQISQFRGDLQGFAAALTDWKSVVSHYRDRKGSIVDSCFCRAYRLVLKGRERLRRANST